MALILSIETGTDICSVALSDDDRLISLRESTEGRQHAQNLGVYINDILRDMDIDADELSAVAVGMGPGSYTGLRIGVSMAKGLCYAHSLPLIAINSLASMVSVALEDFEAGILDIEDVNNAYLCPMIDARRMEVYTQVYDGAFNQITDVEAKIIDETSFKDLISEREFLIFGSGAAKCFDIMKHPNLKLVNVLHSARGMAKLAYDAFCAKQFVDVAYFEPFYLKDFVVTTSAKKFF